MPELDPAALRSLQLGLAAVRGDLEATRTALVDTLAAQRAALAAAEAAQRRADPASMQAAQAEASRLAAVLAAGREDQARLQGRLADLLGQAMDADVAVPGDLPLLLLPVRIETRFEGSRRLKIRIYPDAIHVDALDRGLTPEEEAAGRTYWLALWQDPQGAIESAWAALVLAVGKDRATWVATATRPLNPGQRGVDAPQFPSVSPRRRGAARLGLLPEVFLVTAVQQGTAVRTQGHPVSPELRLGLLADDGTPLVDRDGLRMLEGTQWLADFDEAVRCGMGVVLDLPSDAPVERLYVYGTCRSLDAAGAADALARLLESHWCTDGLAFVRQGTPTNNTEDDRAGWHQRIDPRPVPLEPPVGDAESNGSVMAQALGLQAPWLALLDHAGAAEQAAARAMNAALWPATWGSFLDTLDASNDALSPVVIDAAREFHARFVRGRGPLPALRIGSQPYGVLPVMPLRAADDAPPLERQLGGLLAHLLPNWRNGVAGLPRVPAEGGDDPARTLLEVLGLSPVSFGVQARRALSDNLMQAIGSTTTTGGTAAALESLLRRLLGEALGRYSIALPVGTLEEKSRAVLLPYADPKRDAGFLADTLAAGQPPAEVSSTFQALVAVGWTRASQASQTPPRWADIAEMATTVDPSVRADLLGATARPADTPASRFSDLLARLPGAGEASARPSVRRVQPAGARSDRFADHALTAVRDEERGRLALLAIDELLRFNGRLGTLREAMQRLCASAADARERDFGLLVAETLDTASHRIDAWITGLAVARLERLRSRSTPQGIAVGAFGWLENIRPRAVRAAREGGWVAAPSLAQATTAGLLRSAYVTHNPDADGSSAFAVDLSSARVRLALSIVQGIRNGQPIGALLGYGFERRLHERGCDRFVLSLRALAPLVTGDPAAPASPHERGARDAVAAANVVDLLELIRRYRAPDGPRLIRQALDLPPTDNPYFDSATPWSAVSDPEWTRIDDAIREGIAEADAVADLMLAESVHQLAQGNLRRASATLDASGRGEGPPPDLDFVSTATPGVVVTHRLVVLAPRDGAWSTVAPRAVAAPGVEAWLGSRLGPPSRIVLAVGPQGERVTVADTGLSATDFVQQSADPAQLERILRLSVGLAQPWVRDADGVLAAGEVGLDLAMQTARALRAVLETARPLDSLSLALPGHADWQPDPQALAAQLARLDGLLGRMEQRIQTLGALMAAECVARHALESALLGLAEFGTAVPDLGDPPRSELVYLALDEARSRLARAQALWSRPERTQESVAAFGRIVFGRGDLVPVALSFQPRRPESTTGEQPGLPAPAPGSIERFLADMGTVRPSVAAFGKAMLLAGVTTGHAPALRIIQLCGLGGSAPDRWMGGGLPPDVPTPTAPVVAIVADGGDAAALSGPVEGFVVDDWTEVVALRERRGDRDTDPVDVRVTAGVALHADAPNSQPPQSLLLAMRPDGERWTRESLEQMLSDTLDLARIRLLPLAGVPLAGRVLPAIYTDSASLQGEAHIDWSLVGTSPSELAMSPHLRDLAMIKEP